MPDLHGTYALVYVIGLFTAFSWTVKGFVTTLIWLVERLDRLKQAWRELQ